MVGWKRLIKMVCDILDWRCIIVNELIGNPFLTVLILSILYFIVASRLRWGFDTTLTFAAVALLIIGLMFAGFAAILAFLTIVVVILIVWIIQVIIGNR